jgi:site-specific DNA-methyltransferase (adenine-specific)
VGATQLDISGTSFEFISRESLRDFDRDIANLPYIFRDPHSLDKKIDPRKLQFGSRIDKASGKREEYFTVKEVISPELIRLNNDLVVRLIGVKENPIVNGKAKDFIRSTTKGKRVFLRYDETKYDKDNHLLCYLYLDNKTFINAHLVKQRLVNVDTRFDYKYQERFLKLLTQGS